jgi:hypothetical protein
MEGHYLWLLAGLARAITGTFYLLVLGGGFPLQVIAATAMTVMDKTRQTQAVAKGG